MDHKSLSSPQQQQQQQQQVRPNSTPNNDNGLADEMFHNVVVTPRVPTAR